MRFRLPAAGDEQHADLHTTAATKRPPRTVPVRGAAPSAAVLTHAPDPVSNSSTPHPSTAAAPSRRSSSRSDASRVDQQAPAVPAGDAAQPSGLAVKVARTSRRTPAPAVADTTQDPAPSSAQATATAQQPQLSTPCRAASQIPPTTPIQRCAATEPSTDASVAGCKFASSGVISDENDGSTMDEGRYSQPLLLLLDARLHGMPWESMPSLRRAQVYRMPCLLLVCSATCMQACSHQHAQPELHTDNEATPRRPEHQLSRADTGRCSVRHKALSRTGPEESTGSDLLDMQHQQLRSEARIIDMANTFYLLNPAGDLVDTQRTFEGRFTEEFGWQVSMSGISDQACRFVENKGNLPEV